MLHSSLKKSTVVQSNKEGPPKQENSSDEDIFKKTSQLCGKEEDLFSKYESRCGSGRSNLIELFILKEALKSGLGLKQNEVERVCRIAEKDF
jgi:hypothetical protein